MRIALAFLIIFLFTSVYAQERVLTVGIHYKPIIPIDFFNTGSTHEFENNIDYSITQKFAFSGGMFIRRGLTKNWSIESGINYVKRNLVAGISEESSGFSQKSDFSIVSYEAPLLALLYVQLGDRVYMNTAFGASFDFYPSNVGKRDSDINYLATRNGWLQGGLLANVGYEYRTKKFGYWYVGASYHYPFIPIYDIRLTYLKANDQYSVITKIFGNYLTLDLRYLFHEDPIRKGHNN